MAASTPPTAPPPAPTTTWDHTPPPGSAAAQTNRANRRHESIAVAPQPSYVDVNGDVVDVVDVDVVAVSRG